MDVGTVATPYIKAWLYLLSHGKPVILQGTKSQVPKAKAGTLPAVSHTFTVEPAKYLQSLNNFHYN